MRTKLGLIWATAMSALDWAVDRFWPLGQTGLNTEDDADAFIAEIHAAVPNVVAADLDPIEPLDEAHQRCALTSLSVLSATSDESSPIFDVLTEEWGPLYARRLRALTWPTSEFEVQWRGLTSVLALDWMCAACELADHADCPGCSCACSMAVAA